MAAVGRGSVTGSATAVLTLLLLVQLLPLMLQCEAATHLVGDSKGWGFSVSYDDWAKGRNFAAGDTLVFNYPAGQHNAVPVSAGGYRSCRSSLTAATSGNDKFTLKKGANYFICSIPSHCAAGMKIQVFAN